MAHLKRAQGFEYADVGPNAGEAAPHVRFQLPGNLRKRSEYENVAPGINPEAERGIAREPEEKVSNFDDTLFSGDPTRLMPHLRAIHKMGQATPGTIGVEDLDAVGQSPGTVRPRQISRVMSELPADPGPGYEADHSSVGVAPSEPEGDGHGDIPIEEPTGQTSSKEIFKRSVGKTKQAEPPPPPGMSAARWDKILEGGPKQGEETLPPILARMTDKKSVTDVTDLIRRLELRDSKTGAVKTAEQWAKDFADHLRTAARSGREKRGYKLQGQTEVQGIPIAIENRAGSVRSGKDADGNEWRTKMKHPYGYIKGTKGADGDPVDVYVGPEKEAPAAFVVHQHKVDGTGYDEDKVMLGFPDKRSAKEAYLAHYNDPKFLGPIAKVSVDRLRELVASKKQLVKISRASWAGLLQELQKLGQEEGVLAPQAPQRGRLRELVRKAGPGIGGALGAGVGALVGLKRGKLLSSTLAGLGTGATLGWTPDLYHSAREGIEKYRSGQ